MSLKTIAIDPITGGFILRDGSFTFIEGKEARAQQVRIEFQTIQGECYNNPLPGIPLFDDILIKNPDIVFIESIYANYLRNLGLTQATTTGVFDKENRKFYLNWQAIDAEDNTISGSI